MKSVLMYEYGLKNPSIEEFEDSIYVKDKNRLYILLLINSEKENLIENYFPEYFSGKDNFNLLKTKNDKLFFSYKDKLYVLAEIKDNFEINSNNIFKASNKHIYKERNWSEIWNKKIDNLQDILNKSENNRIKQVSDYYFGMAESASAIFEYNKEKFKSKQAEICRERINDKMYRNPLNVLIDYKEREIAEYIKYLFFEKERNVNEIISILNKEDMNNYVPELLEARLLFPNHFFDMIESEYNIEKNKINKIINKNESYELLINAIFEQYYKNFDVVDWIKK